MTSKTVLMAAPLLLALTIMTLQTPVTALRGRDGFTAKGFGYVRLNDGAVYGRATLFVENSRYGLQVFLEVGEYTFGDDWLENIVYGSPMNGPELLENHICLPSSYTIATGNLYLQYSTNPEDYQRFAEIAFIFVRYKLSWMALFGRKIWFFGGITDFSSCCEGYD